MESPDPERLLQCPYVKNHHIRACRFPYHLIKCKKNHPDVAKQLATCPFNARHLVPRAELSHHISICDDRCCIEQDEVNPTRNPGEDTVPKNTWQYPPCDEDWDQELAEENNTTPFIWGTSRFCENKCTCSEYFAVTNEDTYMESPNPERLLQCPYDKNHHFRACRFPYHLIKCKKNHLDVAKKLATCPFNARHLVPRNELSHHISICDDKCYIEQDVVNPTRNPGQDTLPKNTWQYAPCDEDWDKELAEENNTTPFIWGTTGFCDNKWPASNTAMEHMASGKQVPKTLPWEN
uniref:gametocyte-specific factor 1-like n=1 Tax=Jaculus jaculus TaxID=51337 RepID=UPI001E1AFAC2